MYLELLTLMFVCNEKSSAFFVFFSRGLVPLHNACSYGHYEVTELLLKVQTHIHPVSEYTGSVDIIHNKKL